MKDKFFANDRIDSKSEFPKLINKESAECIKLALERAESIAKLKNVPIFQKVDLPTPIE